MSNASAVSTETELALNRHAKSVVGDAAPLPPRAELAEEADDRWTLWSNVAHTAQAELLAPVGFVPIWEAEAASADEDSKAAATPATTALRRGRGGAGSSRRLKGGTPHGVNDRPYPDSEWKDITDAAAREWSDLAEFDERIVDGLRTLRWPRPYPIQTIIFRLLVSPPRPNICLLTPFDMGVSTGWALACLHFVDETQERQPPQILIMTPTPELAALHADRLRKISGKWGRRLDIEVVSKRARTAAEEYDLESHVRGKPGSLAREGALGTLGVPGFNPHQRKEIVAPPPPRVDRPLLCHIVVGTPESLRAPATSTPPMLDLSRVHLVIQPQIMDAVLTNPDDAIAVMDAVRSRGDRPAPQTLCTSNFFMAFPRDKTSWPTMMKMTQSDNSELHYMRVRTTDMPEWDDEEGPLASGMFGFTYDGFE